MVSDFFVHLVEDNVYRRAQKFEYLKQHLDDWVQEWYEKETPSAAPLPELLVPETSEEAWLADSPMEGDELVKWLLSSINAKSRSIIRMRYGLGHTPPCTLEKVAAIAKVSRERVRKIQEAAEKRMQWKGDLLLYGCAQDRRRRAWYEHGYAYVPEPPSPKRQVQDAIEAACYGLCGVGAEWGNAFVTDLRSGCPGNAVESGVPFMVDVSRLQTAYACWVHSVVNALETATKLVYTELDHDPALAAEITETHRQAVAVFSEVTRTVSEYQGRVHHPALKNVFEAAFRAADVPAPFKPRRPAC
jgi:hypothetical protein